MEEKHRVRACLWRSENENGGRYRRWARSLSPQRNSSSHWERKRKGPRKSGLIYDPTDEQEVVEIGVVRAVSPLSVPKVRGSRRQWSLREIFLPRKASEGREMEGNERELSFSSYAKLSTSDKEKDSSLAHEQLSVSSYAKLSTSDKEKDSSLGHGKPAQKKKTTNTTINRTASIASPNMMRGLPVAQELHRVQIDNRRRIPISAHELHYTANRAQAEELRRKHSYHTDRACSVASDSLPHQQSHKVNRCSPRLKVLVPHNV